MSEIEDLLDARHEVSDTSNQRPENDAFSQLRL
jgi:hypothetical protein